MSGMIKKRPAASTSTDNSEPDSSDLVVDKKAKLTNDEKASDTKGKTSDTDGKASETKTNALSSLMGDYSDSGSDDSND